MIDWNVVHRMQKDEERRLNIKLVKRQGFVDSFVKFLPWHLKDGVLSNPDINLLYMAEQLGLCEEYKRALDSIGYSVNDYILFTLSCCRDSNSFENMLEHRQLTSGIFDVRFFDAKHIIVESDLGKLEFVKNNEVEQRRKILLSYADKIEYDGEKDDCHLLTYHDVKNSSFGGFAVAKTGIVNDVYGSMIHSWSEFIEHCNVDLANGYMMHSHDYDILHRVTKVNRVSADQIKSEDIPHSYSDGKRLVRSLPYLMYKQK